MHPEKIQITEKLKPNPWQPEALMKNIAALHSGRLTVRGANGAGKSVLLLDEWDANLSPENRRLLSARLDTIAQSKVEIEVRHNQEALSLVHSNA